MKKVISEHPYEPRYLDTYAFILYQLDELKLARDLWSNALILSPDSEHLLYQYLFILQHT